MPWLRIPDGTRWQFGPISVPTPTPQRPASGPQEMRCARVTTELPTSFFFKSPLAMPSPYRVALGALGQPEWPRRVRVGPGQPRLAGRWFSFLLFVWLKPRLCCRAHGVQQGPSAASAFLPMCLFIRLFIHSFVRSANSSPQVWTTAPSPSLGWKTANGGTVGPVRPPGLCHLSHLGSTCALPSKASSRSLSAL